MAKRVLVSDYKALIRELHDEDHYPVNAVVRFTDDYQLELTSDLYDMDENEYELGRACDVAEWLGCVYGNTLTKNLSGITLSAARWLTDQIDEIIKDTELENAEYERFYK